MYLPPIEERATDTNSSLLRVHISPAGEGPLEGVGFLRKDAAAQDGGAWTRRGDTDWGEVSVASRTGAEAGHSAARGDGLEGLCGNARCRPPSMEREGFSQWVCFGSYTGLGPWRWKMSCPSALAQGPRM